LSQGEQGRKVYRAGVTGLGSQPFMVREESKAATYWQDGMIWAYQLRVAGQWHGLSGQHVSSFLVLLFNLLDLVFVVFIAFVRPQAT
jgi:hypothetical protein